MPPTTAARWITTSGRPSARARRTPSAWRRSYSTERGTKIEVTPPAARRRTTVVPRKPPPPVTITRRSGQTLTGSCQRQDASADRVPSPAGRPCSAVPRTSESRPAAALACTGAKTAGPVATATDPQAAPANRSRPRRDRGLPAGDPRVPPGHAHGRAGRADQGLRPVVPDPGPVGPRTAPAVDHVRGGPAPRGRAHAEGPCVRVRRRRIDRRSRRARRRRGVPRARPVEVSRGPW